MFKLDLSKLRVSLKRAHALLLVELAGSAAVLVAIAHYNWPAALGVGGLGAILAAERQPHE